MKLVELGHISRPHGYKGAFLVTVSNGADSALSYVKQVYIGKSEATSQPFEIQSADWMPKGWKLIASGIDADSKVIELRGAAVYADRASLKATEENEYYVSDLVGCEVVDVELASPVGIFGGVEEGVKGTTDRWWIETPGSEFAIPATRHFIDKVDVAERRIFLRNLSELAGQ